MKKQQKILLGLVLVACTTNVEARLNFGQDMFYSLLGMVRRYKAKSSLESYQKAQTQSIFEELKWAVEFQDIASINRILLLYRMNSKDNFLNGHSLTRLLFQAIAHKNLLSLAALTMARTQNADKKECPVFDVNGVYWDETPIMFAERIHFRDAIEFLLKEGADPFHSTKKGNLLFTALKEEDFTFVLSLIDSMKKNNFYWSDYTSKMKSIVNQQDSLGDNLITLACQLFLEKRIPEVVFEKILSLGEYLILDSSYKTRKWIALFEDIQSQLENDAARTFHYWDEYPMHPETRELIIDELKELSKRWELSWKESELTYLSETNLSETKSSDEWKQVQESYTQKITFVK